MFEALSPMFFLLRSALGAEHCRAEEPQHLSNWNKLANGVYTAVIGDEDQINRYSDLAGAPPKLDALNQLVDMPQTKALKQVRYRISPDGKISVHIPIEPDEKIYGFGLQFDGTMRNGQILEMKVDHFAQGGGATHAPVPFYVSSKGYGLFFNAAKYIKVHVQVGNRTCYSW